MRATRLAGHPAGAQRCWRLQMLSPAPPVLESKQERSLKSLFPPKCCLEMTVFIHRDCLFAFQFGSAQPLCLQVVRRSLACWELPLSSSPTLPGAEMGRKTPVASMCWGRGLGLVGFVGRGTSPACPGGAPCPEHCSVLSGNTGHAAQDGSPPSGISIRLVQDKWQHECMEKAAVHSCGINATVGRCRQGNQGCLLLLQRCSGGPRLLRGASGCRCERLLRLHVVARGHGYKHGHVSSRGLGNPSLAPGEAPSASRVQQGRRREPEPAAWGKPLSLHGSGRQLELLILTLWLQ